MTYRIKFLISLIPSILLFILIFSVLFISQEYPCLFNHAFSNANYTYCHCCGEPLSEICPNGHRIDGDFCTICGERCSHG